MAQHGTHGSPPGLPGSRCELGGAGMAELGLSEAATALGVSADTIRRRIKRGELQSRRTAEGRVLVTMPDDIDQADGATARPPVQMPAGPDPASLAAELAHVKELLDEVRNHREELSGLVATLQQDRQRDAEERAELRRLLANAQQQVQRLLPAPADAVQEPAVPGATVQQVPGKRSWWQRLFSGA